MKHNLFKVLLLLIAITLFMALTGYSAKHRIIAVFISQFSQSPDQSQVLMEVEKEVTGSGRTEQYMEALKALKERNVPEGGDVTTAFRNEFRINCITASDEGTVTVDFSSRRLNGSARDELLLISQIVATLQRSFPEVDAVAFTVDGEKTETLMGHVDITGSFRQPPLS